MINSEQFPHLKPHNLQASKGVVSLNPMILLKWNCSQWCESEALLYQANNTKIDNHWGPGTATSSRLFIFFPFQWLLTSLTLWESTRGCLEFCYDFDLVSSLAVWYKTKFGSQNFGYQIWFCTRLIRLTTFLHQTCSVAPVPLVLKWDRFTVTPKFI